MSILFQALIFSLLLDLLLQFDFSSSLSLLFLTTFQPRWTSQVVWLPAFAWFPSAFRVKVRLVSLAFGRLEFISTLLPQPRLVSPRYTFHLLQLPRGANYFSLSMTWHFSSFVHASPSNWNTFFPSLQIYPSFKAQMKCLPLQKVFLGHSSCEWQISDLLKDIMFISVNDTWHFCLML